MKKTAEYILNKVVGDLLRDAVAAGELPGVPADLPVRVECDTEERERPCVVVGSMEGEARHPRLLERNLEVVVLSQRDDTPAEDVAAWVAGIRGWLAGRMMEVCGNLHGEGWLVRTWMQQGDVAEEDGKRGWREGVDYKVVVMEV